MAGRSDQVIGLVLNHLVFDRAVVHLQQGDVVLVGDLVKAAVGDDLLDPPVHVGVGLVGVQNVVLANSHEQVAWSDILKKRLIMLDFEQYAKVL